MSDLQGFQDYLIEGEKSEKTITAYLRDILQFMEYCKENDIKEWHNTTMKQYKEYLLYTRFLTPASANRKLVAINQYCSVNEISATTAKVKIQTQNFLENVVTKTETERMVETAKRKRDARAVALIKTLELTGMRISEVLQLTIRDINKDAVLITGKGKKMRTVFIPKSLNKIWLTYCRTGRRNTVLDYLFVGQRGRMGTDGADYLVKKYARLSDVNIDKAHCHSWRHAYILRLLEKGVNIEEVADLVGHSNIQITRSYARKTKEQLLSIIADLD